MPRRLGVDRAELPLAERIFAPLFQAPFLLLATDVEVIFEDREAAMHEQLLEHRHRLHEFLVLCIRAETHYALAARALVPTAIEENDLSGNRKLFDIALEIP